MAVTPITTNRPKTGNPEEIAAWEAAVADAKAAGIYWERPDDDNRSAREIIEDSDLLSNLGDQNVHDFDGDGDRDSFKDMLRDRVGDYENDADAAYRAVQVLQHVEQFDADGGRNTGNDIGNGRIDGLTRDNDARHGTEAGRLQDFGKFGFSNLNGELNNIGAGDDTLAREQADDLGIKWERPDGDDRSAREIIDDNPLLKNLGNQSGVKDMVKQRVGDFENDADAAYRAVQVLRHVEQFDGDGDKIVGRDVGNDSIDGFTNSDEARRGMEAGRLQDFGKHGFPSLKGKLTDVESVGDDTQARQEAERLGIKWERPDGDDRSAREIIDANPLLKNLGNQSGVSDMLKERVGDYENDADAAYRAVQVLQHVERFDADGDKIASKDIGNNRIDGFTNSGEARHGTEAGRLQDFGKHGFSSLKGKFTASTVGDDEQVRGEAEALGFVWERPEGDDRSAREIIDDNPLLKNLGNQSGVKDMLKERVGDFENDADAAFRAAQVVDRIVMYDENGKSLTGGDVANSSIDGFTNSGEARHGTEAGRLQDFGKYGYSVFKEAKSTDEIGLYKEFVESNPDADDASKKMVKYAAILDEYYDSIRGKTGSGDYLTAEALQQYMEENTHLSDEVKAALKFWSQPGALAHIDNAQNPLGHNPDGHVGRSDLSNWTKTYAPKDPGSAIALISEIAQGNAVSGIDTSGFTSDIFEHPENYTAEEKAAVLNELLYAQRLMGAGAEAGMWRDDYGKVSIANSVRGHPDPEKLLQDLNDHIAILEQDPDVVEFLNDAVTDEMTKILENDDALNDAITENYENIKSGETLNTLWETRTGEGVDQQSILAEFYAAAQSYQTALGIEDGAAEIQAAVKNSSYNDEFQSFYENSLVSGDRLTELLAENSYEEAVSAFSMEVALYNAALDPEFTGRFDTQLNENFTTIAQENAFSGATFEDMKKAFGVDGGEVLDEQKVKTLIEDMLESNPEFFLNADGTVATPDQILAGFRGNWDLFRQGTKTFDKSESLSKLFGPPNEALRDAYGKGVLHGVSGLFMAGITIAKGAGSGGVLTDRQIVDITTGSVMSATLLTEGGVKGYRTYLQGMVDKLDEDVLNSLGWLFDDDTPATQSRAFAERMGNIAKKFEEGAKGLGGVAGVAMGAYGIFDGVQKLRSGDTVGGALTIASGSIGVMAGLASAVEGGLGLFASTVPRMIPVMAGALGWVAAGVAVIVAMIPGLIEEGMHQAKQDKFGDVLGDHLTKYGIDGVKDGDYWDIPEEEWPGYDDGPTNGS